MTTLSKANLLLVMKTHTDHRVSYHSVNELYDFLEIFIRDIVKSAERITVLNKKKLIMPNAIILAERLAMERRVNV